MIHIRLFSWEDSMVKSIGPEGKVAIGLADFYSKSRKDKAEAVVAKRFCLYQDSGSGCRCTNEVGGKDAYCATHQDTGSPVPMAFSRPRNRVR